MKLVSFSNNGQERVKDGIRLWLDRAVNPTLSSFAWRKYIFEQVLTGGHSVTLIVRNGAGLVCNPKLARALNLAEYVTYPDMRSLADKLSTPPYP